MSPDIFERIRMALNNASSGPSDGRDFRPDEDTLVGTVPDHLRHMYILLRELEQEPAAPTAVQSALQTLFRAALEMNLEASYEDVVICAGWQVVLMYPEEEKFTLPGCYNVVDV